jgi:hypothetical protein
MVIVKELTSQPPRESAMKAAPVWSAYKSFFTEATEANEEAFGSYRRSFVLFVSFCVRTSISLLGRQGVIKSPGADAGSAPGR